MIAACAKTNQRISLLRMLVVGGGGGIWGLMYRPQSCFEMPWNLPKFQLLILRGKKMSGFIYKYNLNIVWIFSVSIGTSVEILYNPLEKCCYTLLKNIKHVHFISI